jgi:DNA-directed RNA polymerase beta' subunit
MLSVDEIEEKMLLKQTAEESFEAILVLSVARPAGGVILTKDNAWKDRVAREAAIALWAALYGSLMGEVSAVMESVTKGDPVEVAQHLTSLAQGLMKAARPAPPKLEVVQ